MGLPRTIVELPPLLRAAVVGALVAGVLGAVAGLVVGWRTYPPTAWAATVEIGLPAAVLGAVLGLAAGAVGRLVAGSRR